MMRPTRTLSFAILASFAPALAIAAQEPAEPAAPTQGFAEAVRRASVASTATQLSLAPDGRRVAVVSDGRVLLADVSSDAASPAAFVPLPEAIRWCEAPVWSAMSDALAVRCVARSGGERLYVWRRGAAQAMLATDDSIEFYSPVRWISDNRLMYVAKGQPEQPEPRPVAAEEPGAGGPAAAAEPPSCPVIGARVEIAAVECTDSVEVYRSLEFDWDTRSHGDASPTEKPAPTGYDRADVMVFDARTDERAAVATVHLARSLTSSTTRIVPTGDGDILMVIVRLDATETLASRRVDVFIADLGAAAGPDAPLVFDADLDAPDRDERVRRIASGAAFPFTGQVSRESSVVLAPDGRAVAWISQLGESVDPYAPMLVADTLYVGATDGTDTVRAVVLDGRRPGADSTRRLVRRPAAVPPVWTPGGQHVWVVANNQLWAVGRASGPARRLPGPNGRIVTELLSATDDGALVSTVDLLTGQYGIWRVALGSGEWLRVVEEDIAITRAAAVETPGGDVSVAYVAMTLESPPNVYVRRVRHGDRVRAPARRVTDVSGPVRTPAMQDTVFTYRVGNDRFGTALLVRPAGVPGPVPTIVHAYPSAGAVSRHRNRLCLGDFDGAAALHCAALARGYALLLADVPMTPHGVYGPRGPVADMVEGVMAAVDAATRTGWVDTTRLGVIGHSQGGYMVNALVAHTARFRAAVSMSGMSNMLSRMMGGAAFGREWVYDGPARMEKPIHEDPLRYVESSPSAFLENVTTPLLLITGSKDLHVHHTQSEEMFRGLAQLGQPAELVRFRHAAHGDPWFLDAAYARALDWFDKWFDEQPR